ncbi:hypothetical protein O1M63_56420 [Streptomyces mirabilis]|nr:hypothetical protein [Streptomyces mirabilis]
MTGAPSFVRRPSSELAELFVLRPTDPTEAGTAPGFTYAVSISGSAAIRERSSWARLSTPRTR